MTAITLKVSNSKKGFSLIEAVIVVGIIVVLILILVSNFPQAKLQFSLSRTAYKAAQDLRRAQNLAMSSTDFVDSSGVSHPVKGYGVYVNKTTNPKSYTIYADKMPGDGQYVVGTDYIVESVSLEQGVSISSISGGLGGVFVNFVHPDPQTIIYPFGTDCPGASCAPAGSTTITLALDSDPTQTKDVVVHGNGLVEVGVGSLGTAITCSANQDCGSNGPVGSPFCQNGNVWQNYVTRTCANPGTTSSYCPSTTIAQQSQSCPGPGSGSVWQETQPAGNVNAVWQATASSSDGSHLVAAGGALDGSGYLYVSSNYGQSWTPSAPATRFSNYGWYAVASSADGMHLIAGDKGGLTHGGIYISTNFGTTWTETFPAGPVHYDWASVASSADGTHLIAANSTGSSGGRLFISRNSGSTWSETRPAGNVSKGWRALAWAGNTDNVIAADGGNLGKLYISHNAWPSGETWTEYQPGGLTTYNWLSAAAGQATGGDFIVGNFDQTTNAGHLYTSFSEGASWTEVLPGASVPWGAVATSTDGKNLIAGQRGGRLYISTNFGTDWTEAQLPGGNVDRFWQTVSSSADGLHLIAGDGAPGRLYLYTGQATCTIGACTP